MLVFLLQSNADVMSYTNETNILISEGGTSSDPITYNFQPPAQSDGPPWMLFAFVLVVGLIALTGFLLRIYFGKKRK
jgi:hypothetical protein